jgi:hypothetical protein
MKNRLLKFTFKTLLFVGFAVSNFNQASAQVAMTRSIFVGDFIPITVLGGATAATAAQGDDAFAGLLPIGFSFGYTGSNYTTFGVSSNGWMSFTATVGSATNTNLFSATAPNATLAPWFDDLSSSEILYQTSGTPGSQITIVQWTSLSYFSVSTKVIQYQVWLYEGTNVIEFYYGAAPTGTGSGSESASIGIENATGGNNQYIDAVSGSSFISNSTLQTTRWPSYCFRFTPGAPSAIAGGNYTVGAGQTYPNLNEAVAELNHKGISGPVTLTLTDAQYDITPAGGSNFFPVLVGPVTGLNVSNPLTITKIGTPAIIQYAGTTSGSIGHQVSATAISGLSAEPIIGLIGADYVTLNNLDIRSTATGTSDYGVGLYNSSTLDGATNNIIQNVTVTMNRANTSSRGFASAVPSTPASALGANSLNTFRDFTIKNVYGGIQLTGNATFPDVNNSIGNSICTVFNTIGDPSTANDIGNATTQTYGIRATSQSGVNIFNNSIRNVTNTGGTADGVFVENFQGTSSVYNNKVQGIRNSGTGSTTSISGIRASHTVTGTHTLRIYNNAVSEITSGYTGIASATRTLKGIHISGTGGTTTQLYQIYNNSVSIDGSASPNLSSTCFEVSTSSGPVYNLGNNIFANFTATQAGVARHFSLASTSATLLGAAGTVSNNNDIFVANDAGVTGFAALGNLTTYTTVANWTTATTLDAVSLSLNPSYLSNTSNLHSAALGLNATGVAPPAFVTNDLDCALRAPDNDMGAYILTACAGVPTAGSITGASAVCSNLSTTLTLAGASAEAGITYQWGSSLVPGGPYTTLLGTSVTQSTGPLAAPVYYVVGVGCTASGLFTTTTEFTVGVNALPVVAVTPTTGLICLPGGAAIPLSATGALTYSWLPIAGLTPATGSAVSANPTSTTTYTVTGTDGNGCLGTATSVITVANNPSISSVTATPSAVCLGGSSQLQVNFGAPLANNYTFSNGSGAVLDPMIGATTILTTADDDTPNAVAQNIGFTFNYNGSAYTQFSVSPDGWMLLGGGVATGQFTNAVTSATNTPKIYPYWDDMATGTTGNVTSLMIGTAPNRILITQWFVTIPRATAGPANSTFQTWLYETSGIIEFKYGTMGAAAMSSSVGLTGGTTNFNCVTLATPSASTTVANDANPGQPVSGAVYTFTPPTATVAWTPVTFLDNATIVNPLASGVVTTTAYTVTATAPSTCFSTGTVTVSAGALLTSSAAASPSNTICAGQNVTLQATPIDGGAPYTYAWSGPNAFTSTSQNPILTAVTALEEGIYTVIISDNCGSTSTSTVTLTVNPLPVMGVTPLTALYCAPGTPVTMTASGASTYSWLPATGLSATTGITVDASPASNTMYTVTGTTTFGCTATASATINNSVSVTMSSVTATPSTICNGDNSVLAGTAVLNSPSSYCQATYSNGTGFGDYISSVSLNTLLNTSAGSATPYYTLYPQAGTTTTTLVAGNTYTLTLVAGTYTDNDLAAWIDYNQNGVLDDAGEKLGETDNLGASPLSTSFTFTVPLTANNGSLRLRVREMDHGGTNDITPCTVQSSFGETEDYIITVTGGVDPLSYAWTPTTFLSSINTATTTATAMTATTAYTLTATTAGGCVASGIATVTVNQPTTSTISPVNCITYTSPDGSVYTTSGTYVNVIPNVLGCDSTITINLTINQPTTSTIAPTVCDTYTSPNGSVYTASGTYVNVIPNAAGCDSTITINLTVNYSTSSTINPIVCDSYTSPDGSIYTISGMYMNTIPNAAGCDSNIMIMLSVYGSSTSTLNPIVCDTYTSPDGSVYTASGMYMNTIPNFIGCDSIITINLTVNYTPIVFAGNDLTVCQNGQANLSGSGASTYTWDNGITNGVSFVVLGTTTYTVTGTSAAGCIATDAVTITAIPVPTVDAGANITQCGDQNVTLNGSGAFVYTWNNGVLDGVAFNSPYGTTSYIVTGVDTYGCSNTDIVNVTINAIPVATITAVDALTLTATPSNESYQWIDCATNAEIVGATNPTFNATQNGSYAVIVTSNGGCVDTSACAIVDEVGFDVISNDKGVFLYPNPTNGDLFVTLSEIEFVDALIYDAQGKLISEINGLTNGSMIDLKNVVTGIYMIHMKSEGNTMIQRIVKN